MPRALVTRRKPASRCAMKARPDRSVEQRDALVPEIGEKARGDGEGAVIVDVVKGIGHAIGRCGRGRRRGSRARASVVMRSSSMVGAETMMPSTDPEAMTRL